jgi:dynein light intermediate chain 1
MQYRGREEGEQKKNLWASLLQSVGVRRENRQSHLLLLGNRGAGKRSLIKAINKPFFKQLGIQHNTFDDIGSDYSMLESSYIYVRDIADLGTEGEGNQHGIEESTLSRVNVWIISEEEMGAMIPKLLTPEDLEYTFAIIIPDMESPWDIMNQCEKWMQVLKEGIFKITPNLGLKEMTRLRERIEILYKTYEEPEFDKDGKLILKKMKNVNLNKTDVDDSRGDIPKLEEFDTSLMEDQDMMNDLRKEMELPEGTLVTNLFIPTAVVCSKTDLIEQGDKEIKGMLEKNLELIQYFLRKFCLTYGSSLIFTSVNSNSNV